MSCSIEEDTYQQGKDQSKNWKHIKYSTCISYTPLQRNTIIHFFAIFCKILGAVRHISGA